MNNSKVFTLSKYIFYGLILFLLFHFESSNIGAIKISHLWKGVLLLYLIFKIQSYKSKYIHVYLPLIWLSILQLSNIELFYNPINAFFLFFTTLLLPLVGIYLLRYSFFELQKGMLFFSSFFILSFLPYELGFVKSLGNVYQLTGYGAEQTGVAGPFQGPHAASTALAASFLVILYFWLAKQYNRLYMSILLVLCFYFLIFTYVRTGMLMVLIGSIPILKYYSKKEALTRFRLILLGSIFSILISAWILSNNVLMDRITGNRLNNTEAESFQNLGSGRGQIYIYAIDIFLEANIFEQLIGIGQTEQVNRMNKKLGAGLIPHNGFLLIILNNGVLGLFVFLVFLKNVVIINKGINSSYKVLLAGLFFAYLVMTFFQNYDLLFSRKKDYPV